MLKVLLVGSKGQRRDEEEVHKHVICLFTFWVFLSGFEEDYNGNGQ